MASIGAELSSKTPENTHLFAERGTDSGTPSDESANNRNPADPDLQSIIDAWHQLPADVRKVIVGVVKLSPRTPATSDTAT